MRTGLLERDTQVETLLEAVTKGGSVVLVTGEAGIGKTSVVRAFMEALPSDVRVLWGACDDLRTPRALGPLRDAAAGSGGPLEQALAHDPHAVFTAAMAELRGPHTTVLIMEDIHWADEATVDVLRYLARRVAELTGVLVLTCRDAVGESPARQLLGDLVGTQVQRMELPALSASAVSTLAYSAGHDPVAVHTLTRGNPFYVTKMLEAPAGAPPAPVVDAVVARVRLLSPRARAACEQLSVVPSHVSFDLADALFVGGLEALADAEEHGIVEIRPDGVAFRLEVERRAVESSLPQLRLRSLRRAVVHALRSVQAGSHHEALTLVESAMHYADALPAQDRAALAEDYARELHIACRPADAVRAGRIAVALRQRLGDNMAYGESLLWLAGHLDLAGYAVEAQTTLEQAVAVLEMPLTLDDAFPPVDDSIARGYVNTAERLYQDEHFASLATHLTEGLAFTRKHGFLTHAYTLDVYEGLLRLRLGSWDEAEQHLRGLLNNTNDLGALYVHAAAALARVLLRRGHPAAKQLLAGVWDRAKQSRRGLIHAATALAENAWLTGRSADVRTTLSGVTTPELSRHLARAEGLACAAPSDDPYEQALALAESGDVESTLRALQTLEDLGAAPAAALVRQRLRSLGVRHPRRTSTNPAGLTQRQVDVLTLVAAGLTNAEIAERLVVSVRTVDHHVSAVLGKLGVQTRRQAAKAASTLGLLEG